MSDTKKELVETALDDVTGGDNIPDAVDEYPEDNRFLRVNLDSDCRWNYYKDDNNVPRKCGNCERIQKHSNGTYFCTQPF